MAQLKLRKEIGKVFWIIVLWPDDKQIRLLTTMCIHVWKSEGEIFNPVLCHYVKHGCGIVFCFGAALLLEL